MKYNKEFSARRHNKYSIRKFSVGLASILVGSIFFYGQNAQAAEGQQSDVSTEQSNDGQVQKDSSAAQTSSQSNHSANAQPVSADNSVPVSSSNGDVQQPNAQAISNSSQPKAVQAPVQPANQAQQNGAQQNQQPAKPVLKQAHIEKKDITAQTKEVDVFKYVEENSKYLTENERQFFLRTVARKTPILTKEWDNVYNKNYGANSGNASTRTIQEKDVQNVKIATDALQKLVESRDKDEFYTDFRSDNKAPRTNSFTVNNSIDKDKDGKQSIKLGLKKKFVYVTYPDKGKWLSWNHRFEHWGIRTNDSINNKIEEVRLKYGWNGKQYDEVVTRDKDGFYWFKEDEKYGYKGHLGGGVDFVVKFKKNAVIDKAKDAIWGYILSDAEHKNPMAIVNYEFKKFNFGQSNFEKNFNDGSLATLKQKVTSKINDATRGFSDQDAQKNYYLGLVNNATETATTPEQYAEVMAKLSNIEQRVTHALREVRTATPIRRTVNENTKDVNVLKYIEENSKYLSDEERQFFLRQVTRHSGFHNRDWDHIYRKDYDGISANVNTRTIGTNNVAQINKILSSMYELIEGRNNDQFYKELTTDAASNNLPNSYTLDNNVTQSNGQQTIKVNVGKQTLQFSEYQNGSWWNWKHRFAQWGLRTSEALDRKIDKVVAKYRWSGEDKEDVLVRDSKGFYWFKEDEKFSDGKAKVGGNVDFLLTFKKDAVIDKDNDKLWGYVISDSNELETRAGANVGFGKVDFAPILSKLNSQTVSTLKQELLSNIETLKPVITANEQDADALKNKVEAIGINNLTEEQFGQVKLKLDALTKEVAQAALNNNLVTVPGNKEHLRQYAQTTNDSYFYDFQSLNTDPVNSLNADGSVTLKPKGYLFYNLKTENELAPGKQVNLIILATQVAEKAKFEYAVQGDNNKYIVGISQIPKKVDGQYELQNFTIPQGAKKFAIRLDNREGTTNNHVNVFTLVPESNKKNKADNLLVIPDNLQHIRKYAEYTKDGQFLSFQSLNTTPINSFNPDGSLTLKPKGYLFYNLKAQGELAPGKQFNILVMTSQIDPNTKLEYGFHDQNNRLNKTVTAITKTIEGTYRIDNVTVPENVKDIALRLDNRTGSSDTIIQGVFVLPKKETEV